MCGSDPVVVNRITFALKQCGGLIKWQTNNIGVGADELDNEDTGNALDGIPTGLAAPFARRQIAFKFIR